MEALTGVTRVIIGGINSFTFVIAEGVDVWPASSDLEISLSAIILKPGYAWQTGFADHNTLEYVETQQYTQHGPVFTAELRGFLPDDLLGNMRALQNSFNKKYIVAFTTHQSQGRVFGTPNNPCMFSFNTTTAKVGNRKGASFSFNTKTQAMALFT